jgi:capsular exopolysaccharide synthesis family protein
MTDTLVHDADRLDLSSGPMRVLWRRKGLFAVGVLCGLGVTALYALLWPPVFQSTAQILVVKKRPDPNPAGDARFAPPEDVISGQHALLKSPLVIERAVKKDDLRSLPSLAKEKTDVVEDILKKLSVTRNKDAQAGFSSVFTISYRGPVAEDCNTILESIIEAYNLVLDETYRNAADDTLELVARARNVLHEELAQKEAAYQAFHQEAPLFSKEANPPDRLSGIEAKRTSLLLRRAQIQGQQAAIEKASKAGEPREILLAMIAEFSNNTERKTVGQAPSPQENLQNLMAEEQKLLATYGPDHAEVRSIRKRIDLARDVIARPAAGLETSVQRAQKSSQGRLQDPVAAHLEYLSQELDHVQLEETLLARALEQEQETARRLKSYEIKDQALRNDIARTQQLYEGIVKRLQDAGLAKEFGRYEARVLAPPGSGGIKQVVPNPLVVIGLGGLLSLLGGFGAAYLGEMRARGFRTPEEIDKELGWSVIGRIPLLPSNSDVPHRIISRFDPALCTYHRPGSVASEAYRGIRTTLCFSMRGKGRQVLLITSPEPGDGKTTLAANLAVCLAQSGKRVVLCDADLRRPRLHKLFGVSDDGGGLVSVLANGTDVESAIQPTGIEGLEIIPGGSRAQIPAELLSSSRLENVFEILRNRYDFVIVDTPALLSVTDPCAVAARADGVILVLRASRHTRREATQARQLLESVDATVLGVAINGVSIRGGDWGPAYMNYPQNEAVARPPSSTIPSA